MVPNHQPDSLTWRIWRCTPVSSEPYVPSPSQHDCSTWAPRCPLGRPTHVFTVQVRQRHTWTAYVHTRHTKHFRKFRKRLLRSVLVMLGVLVLVSWDDETFLLTVLVVEVSGLVSPGIFEEFLLFFQRPLSLGWTH